MRRGADFWKNAMWSKCVHDLVIFDGPAQWYHRMRGQLEWREHMRVPGVCRKLTLLVSAEMLPRYLLLLRRLENRKLIKIRHRKGDKLFLYADSAVLLRCFSDPELLSSGLSSLEQHNPLAAVDKSSHLSHLFCDFCKHEFQVKWPEKVNGSETNDAHFESRTDNGASDLSYLCSDSYCF